MCFTAFVDFNRVVRCRSRGTLSLLSLCICPLSMALVTRSFDAARSYLGSFAWDPFVRLSRAVVLNLLGRVETGYILIIDTDGSETVCGQRWPKAGLPKTELKVLKGAFWVRLLLFADMVRERTPSDRIRRPRREVTAVALGSGGKLHAGRSRVFGSCRLLQGICSRYRIWTQRVRY